MKAVSVIILNWNGAEMLRRFLPEVIATTNSDIAELIVADNGSTDESLRVLAEEFPDVKLIRFDTNYGFAEGYNRAITQVNTEYVVLLNSDVATTAGWIETLYDYMQANPNCAACQPKLLAVNAPNSFEYAGAAGGFLDRNGYPYCRGRIFDTIERDNGQYNTPIHIDWASGAALMVRRDLYISAGGLDPTFFAHMEEIDLCWRLRLLGHTIDAVPTASVFHLGGGSLPMGNPRKTYLNFRNNLLLLKKNLPKAVRGRRLFVRRLLDTIAWAKFMVTFDFQSANAILRAHRDFRHHYPTDAPTPQTEGITPADNSATQQVEGTHAEASERQQLTGFLPIEPQSDLISLRPNILIHYYLLRHRHFTSLPHSNHKHL